MLRSLLLSLVAVPVLSFSANALDLTAVRDSVGVERKSGKLFVQHKVEPKETLYALSRKYGVPVTQIVEANPSVQTTIKIGEIVLIPRGFVSMAATPAKSNTAPAASNRTYTVNSIGNKLHTVEPKQTLYSVSRLYNVSVENLRFWNRLPGNTIEIGQELIVGIGEPTPTQKPVYMPEPDDEMTKAADSNAVASAGPATPTPVTPTPVAVATKAHAEEEEPEADASTAGVNKMIESGMAEMIDPKTNDTNKYLALHKTAPVGTIMQVKNAMNGQVVYVRVIGKLPATGENDRVVVRLSKKAYQKLGAVDPRFRVELSYMP
ncbi:septal ring lytic transglycosylase RlpA family protein [Pontibacter anaerobius]|uniref:LysM peptidoglycan-binding domain-containing protein n=1 Tax=Pontibacter anaerobius TaxID=2993940 RepID=A0ABT3RGX8_9BACT|nr:LysM peptidoglycan-binding domain-containing protein [Pontibacter anaerobius]MCX2740805.1 LysM peptidoglycan-binding domain-containing protein [Pontibacter anaerobius]